MANQPSPNRGQQDGGYSCRFVQQPKELQTECLICLCVVRDPYIVSCCGLKFCRVCINAIEATKGPCPHCQSRLFTSMADKQLKRQLDERKVYCSNETKGCKWTGELRQLLTHLGDSNTSTACHYEAIDCNRCQVKVQRRDLAIHMQVTCPHRDVACVYEYAGCRVKVRRTGMEAHFQKNIVEHARLTKEHSRKMSSDLDSALRTIKSLSSEVTKIKKETMTKMEKNSKRLEKSQNDLKELQKKTNFNLHSTRNIRYLLYLILGGLLLIGVVGPMSPEGKFFFSVVLGAMLAWVWVPNWYA